MEQPAAERPVWACNRSPLRIPCASTHMLSHQKPMVIASAKGGFTTPLEESSRPFEAYVNNGGTAVALRGPNYSIVAADTRLSTGYSIHTRDCSRVSQLTSQCAIATSGMHADTVALHKNLKYAIKMYEHNHRKEMPVDAIAQLLSQMLYKRRFFPLYTFNVLGGIDAAGAGVAFSYDAIGTLEKVPYSAAGSGSGLIEPLLDSQVAFKNQKIKPAGERSVQEALDLLKDTYASAGERDIMTGDSVEFMVRPFSTLILPFVIPSQ